MSYRFIVKTDCPIAWDSPDHLNPHGTKNDNHTSYAFIADIETAHTCRPLHFMDLGCAGGLLVHDMLRRGHIAIGLEGSDYSIQHQRAEWPSLHQKNLFTCDIGKSYDVILECNEEASPYQCDVITAWEVTEHIHPDCQVQFFENIRNHLKIGGHFYASIGLFPDVVRGINLHQSVFPKEKWDEILSSISGLKRIPYPYPPNHAVCDEPKTSILVALERV